MAAILILMPVNLPNMFPTNSQRHTLARALISGIRAAVIAVCILAPVRAETESPDEQPLFFPPPPNEPRLQYLAKFSSVPGQSKADALSENATGATRNEITPEFVSYCQFTDQCPSGDGACREAEPELREIRPGHRVACFKAEG